MDGYKLYIRVNEAGVIIHGFSSAFEKPQEGDILITEDGPRHFHLFWPEPLTYESGQYRGQYRFKWVNGERIERSQAELDAERAARPTAPPSNSEKIAQLEADKLTLMESMAELYEMVLALQNTGAEQA
jgi:hypothetical protein